MLLCFTLAASHVNRVSRIPFSLSRKSSLRVVVTIFPLFSLFTHTYFPFRKLEGALIREVDSSSKIPLETVDMPKLSFLHFSFCFEGLPAQLGAIDLLDPPQEEHVSE